MHVLLLVTLWTALGLSGTTGSPTTSKCILKKIGGKSSAPEDKGQVICVGSDEGNSQGGLKDSTLDGSNTWPRHFQLSQLDSKDDEEKRSGKSNYLKESHNVGHKFMRFGRDIGHNFMRFGRTPSSSAENQDTEDDDLQTLTEDDDAIDSDDLLHLLPDQWLNGSGDDVEISPDDVTFDRVIKDTDYNNRHSFMRFGRNGHKFMRFGRGDGHNFMRFGRGDGHKFLRFGRPEGHNFLRFGRAGNGHKFLRFGRGNGHNFLRFGRSDQHLGSHNSLNFLGNLEEGEGEVDVLSSQADGSSSSSEGAAVSPPNAIENKVKRSGHIFMRFGRK